MGSPRPAIVVAMMVTCPNWWTVWVALILHQARAVAAKADAVVGVTEAKPALYATVELAVAVNHNRAWLLKSLVGTPLVSINMANALQVRVRTIFEKI